MLKVFCKKLALITGVVVLALTSSIFYIPAKALAASCNYTGADFGSVTMTMNIQETGSYRAWSRIQIPSSANNSYLLKITEGSTSTCYDVGKNSSLPLNTWKWVDYQDGNTNSKINHTFSSTGSKTITMIGTSDGVLLDRVILTKDTALGGYCDLTNSTSTGDNCASPPNTPPSVTLAASPLSGNAPLSTTLTASPTDSDGSISKVEFYSSGTKVGEKLNTAPWTLSITGLVAGSYTYTAIAYDNNGAPSNASAPVTVTVTSVSTFTKKGDANCDGVTDGTDLIAVLTKWKSFQNRANGDVTGDGFVNGDDLIDILTGWKK